MLTCKSMRRSPLDRARQITPISALEPAIGLKCGVRGGSRHPARHGPNGDRWIDNHELWSARPTATLDAPASSKGRMPDFDSVDRGSNPCAGTIVMFFSIAQQDRAPDSEFGGQRFESSSGSQFKRNVWSGRRGYLSEHRAPHLRPDARAALKNFQKIKRKSNDGPRWRAG